MSWAAQTSCFQKHLDILDVLPPHTGISESLPLERHGGWSWLPRALINAVVFLSHEIIIPNPLMIHGQKKVTKTLWPMTVMGIIG